MPGSVAILAFIDYCGGLEKFGELMSEINKDERPIYEIAREFEVNASMLSRYLSAHYRREYTPTEETRITLDHELERKEAAIAEQRRRLSGRGSAPILSFKDPRGRGSG